MTVEHLQNTAFNFNLDTVGKVEEGLATNFLECFYKEKNFLGVCESPSPSPRFILTVHGNKNLRMLHGKVFFEKHVSV